ncbi:MAG: DUF1326 domain-containing protein [Vicinamibacterales bacterium]
MGYQIDGRILEVCDCGVLCPCWVGEDPDNGACDAIVAWKVDKGTIDGVDVSGHVLALAGHIPGNILQGNWKALMVIDDEASAAQKDALVNVFSGKLGGPIADLAALIGEVIAIEQRKITFEVDGASGFLKIEGITEAELDPFLGPSGEVTALHESVFSTIPGSPAFVGKAKTYKRTTKQYGLIDVDLKGHNAVQGSFHFEA